MRLAQARHRASCRRPAVGLRPHRLHAARRRARPGGVRARTSSWDARSGSTRACSSPRRSPRSSRRFAPTGSRPRRYEPDGGLVDPGRMTLAWFAEAVALGAEPRLGAEVTDLDALDAGTVVVAAGGWTSRAAPRHPDLAQADRRRPRAAAAGVGRRLGHGHERRRSPGGGGHGVGGRLSRARGLRRPRRGARGSRGRLPRIGRAGAGRALPPRRRMRPGSTAGPARTTPRRTGTRSSASSATASMRSPACRATA